MLLIHCNKSPVTHTEALNKNDISEYFLHLPRKFQTRPKNCNLKRDFFGPKIWEFQGNDFVLWFEFYYKPSPNSDITRFWIFFLTSVFRFSLRSLCFRFVSESITAPASSLFRAQLKSSRDCKKSVGFSRIPKDFAKWPKCSFFTWKIGFSSVEHAGCDLMKEQYASIANFFSLKFYFIIYKSCDTKIGTKYALGAFWEK